jgi:hypothetical protein
VDEQQAEIAHWKARALECENTTLRGMVRALKIESDAHRLAAERFHAALQEILKTEDPEWHQKVAGTALGDSRES